MAFPATAIAPLQRRASTAAAIAPAVLGGGRSVHHLHHHHHHNHHHQNSRRDHKPLQSSLRKAAAAAVSISPTQSKAKKTTTTNATTVPPSSSSSSSSSLFLLSSSPSASSSSSSASPYPTTSSPSSSSASSSSSSSSSTRLQSPSHPRGHFPLSFSFFPSSSSLLSAWLRKEESVRCFSSSSSSSSATTADGSSNNSYDVVVVGGGPGGYVGAIKAAQLGLRTACVEKRGALGGTCLNVGCIPSKALLNISHKFHELQHSFAGMGIVINGETKIDVGTMQKKKGSSVKALTGGIEFLFKKNGVDYIKGDGKLIGGDKVVVSPLDGGAPKELVAKNIVIATGSEASPMPGGVVVADGKDILTSTEALELSEVPEKLLVIGGGVIGLEMGSVWSRLGAKVEVVEYLDGICPFMDAETAKAFQRILEKQNISFRLSTKVVGASKVKGGVEVAVESVKDGKAEKIIADKVLLAVGRRPHTEGLGLQELQIPMDKAGRIEVDENFRIPSLPSVRAIGDVIAGPMLAHKAEEEGIAVAEMIAEKGAGHVNYNTIPSVVYTHPEVAGVGKTEEELKADGVNYKKGKFPFGANSRAKTNDDAEGVVKVLTDASNDRILGAWLIGPAAGELISELIVGMEYGAASEDIARTCHAHPTLSEAVKEACMAAHAKPIHSV